MTRKVATMAVPFRGIFTSSRGSPRRQKNPPQRPNKQPAPKKGTAAAVTAAVYKKAIEIGILDGLARSFKADLRRFKPIYRKELSKQYWAAIRAAAE